MNDRIVYTAVFGPYKPYKKHKQWTGDGRFIVSRGTATLVDEENGRELGRINLSASDVVGEGKGFVIGNYECELQELQDEKMNPFISQPVNAVEITKSPPVTKIKPFKNPMMRGSEQRLVPKKASDIAREPLYPVDGGFVLPRPPFEPSRSSAVDVVLDPRLVKEMREHQLIGVKFMYECVMGHQDKIEGVILADEMGLGKTLQCIALLYTLMKQGPDNGQPVVKRALIVVPSTLVKNWHKEFKKWLGDERLQTFAVDGKENTAPEYYKIRDNWNGKVLIISYDQYTRNLELLSKVSFDIMICDEGHRLKNQKTKIYAELNGVDTMKRILLTGTPVQNDLTELYAIVDFVNPKLLGKFSRFQRLFIDPINASREPEAADDVKEHGRFQMSHLTETLNYFVLRRTSDTISKFLPTKIEYVVCCRPTAHQLAIYKEILGCSGVRKILLSHKLNENCHFGFISALRKLCNHPLLLKMQEEDEPDNVLSTVNQSIGECLVEKIDVPKEELSGKMQVVLNILHTLRKESPTEKIVLVSNFTKTLDILQEICSKKSYKTCRLDGSTAITKRQEIVDFFNSKSSDIFVFLLSTKAGGVGLNLVGASRLVLFDLDWNPAHDIQAMARIWRDGQKKTVHIYRLLTTGSIEEKIFQRQVMKQGLCTVVKDSSSNTKFSIEDLKDLFTLSEMSDSTTHDKMNCTTCLKSDSELGVSTSPSNIPARKRNKYNIFDCDDNEQDDSKALNMSQLKQWQHFGGDELQNLDSFQDCLKSSVDAKIVSFVFKNMFDTNKNPSTQLD